MSCSHLTSSANTAADQSPARSAARIRSATSHRPTLEGRTVSDEFVRVTADLIEAGRSERGGWSKAQFALLGVPWPPPAGWKVGMIGRTIPRSDAERFVSLRPGSALSGGLFAAGSDPEA